MLRLTRCILSLCFLACIACGDSEDADTSVNANTNANANKNESGIKLEMLTIQKQEYRAGEKYEATLRVTNPNGSVTKMNEYQLDVRGVDVPFTGGGSLIVPSRDYEDVSEDGTQATLKFSKKAQFLSSNGPGTYSIQVFSKDRKASSNVATYKLLERDSSELFTLAGLSAMVMPGDDGFVVTGSAQISRPGGLEGQNLGYFIKSKANPNDGDFGVMKLEANMLDMLSSDGTSATLNFEVGIKSLDPGDYSFYLVQFGSGVFDEIATSNKVDLTLP